MQQVEIKAISSFGNKPVLRDVVRCGVFALKRAPLYGNIGRKFSFLKNFSNVF